MGPAAGPGPPARRVDRLGEGAGHVGRHAAAGDEADASEAIDDVQDPEATAEASRHVLVGGEPSVAAFSDEVAEAHGDEEPLPAHTVAKAIGNVLAGLET